MNKFIVLALVVSKTLLMISSDLDAHEYYGHLVVHSDGSKTTVVKTCPSIHDVSCVLVPHTHCANKVEVDGNTTSRNYNRTVLSIGETTTRSRDTDVTHTDDGASWIRNDSATHNSQIINSRITGSVTQNEDGSISFDLDRTVTTQNGETYTRSKDVDLSRDELEPMLMAQVTPLSDQVDTAEHRTVLK